MSIRKKRGINIYINALVFALLILLLSLFFVVFDANAISSNVKDGSDTLVLLGNENLAPIVYNDKGVAKGVAVDIAKAIGDKIGYNVEVIAVNWKQAQTMVLNGDADGLLQINPSPDRNELYDFSLPLLQSDFSIFVRSDNATLRTIGDLENKRVGVEAYGYPNTLLQEYELIDAEMIYDWEASFRDLSNGVLDAIIVDRWIGEYKLADSKLSGIKIIEQPIETQYSRIAVKKGNVEILSLLNSGLKEITDDGTIDEIMERWKGKRVIYRTEEYFQKVLLRSAALVLSSVTLVTLYFYRKYRRLSKKLEVMVKERTEKLNHANEMLKAANSKLEQISMIDGLTSIENRRAFDLAYERAWELCRRELMPLALIMIDIDHFKLYNDTYGHISGDQALIKIAEVIKGVIRRPEDIAARYGGEEFVVMLMNTNSEQAIVIAEDIRRNIEDLGIENGDAKTPITVSLGVSSVVPEDRISAKELILTADRALYKAKEDGRNKTIVWKHE